MTLLRRLARSFARRALFGARPGPIRREPVRLCLTMLEDRLAPAFLTVNSLADGPVSAASSTLTLREAITLVNSGGTAVDTSGHSLAAAKASQINATSPFGSNDVIEFASSVFGSSSQQIVLTDGRLVLDRSAAIDGPAAGLAINGNNQSAVFEIDGATVDILGLTIEGGAAFGDTGGGGISNNGTLTLTNTNVSGNSAAGGNGGGIFNSGTLTLVNSSISNNRALNDGGIDNFGTLTLRESSISGNTAAIGNGGLANYGGSMTLVDSTITGNSAVKAGGIGNYDNGTTVGVATIVNSTVAGNTATNAGGIFNTAALTLIASSVSGNAASVIGGGVINSGTAAFVDSVVSGNLANDAGGIGNYGTLSLTESNASANSAVSRNDIGNFTGTTAVVDSTATVDPAVEAVAASAPAPGSRLAANANSDGAAPSTAAALSLADGGTPANFPGATRSNADTGAAATGVNSTADDPSEDTTSSGDIGLPTSADSAPFTTAPGESGRVDTLDTQFGGSWNLPVTLIAESLDSAMPVAPDNTATVEGGAVPGSPAVHDSATAVRNASSEGDEPGNESVPETASAGETQASTRTTFATDTGSSATQSSESDQAEITATVSNDQDDAGQSLVPASDSIPSTVESV